MSPQRHARRYPDVQGTASREAISPDERRRKEHRSPESTPPESYSDGRSLSQPDKDGGRRYGQHPDGYGRESAPTPYLILYQTRAPLSLRNCPPRDHFLRHIGLLYTGS